VELSAMQAKIQSDVKDEISKSQRDYFLREQVRAIHKELGELDDRGQEIAEYAKRIKRARMPKEVDDEAKKQLRRLEQMHPDSAESSVVRTYLDWLTELPWHKATKDLLDIQKVPSCASLAPRGWEKPRWAKPLPKPCIESSSGFRWAVFATRPRFGAIVGPISAPCRDALFKDSKPVPPTTRFS
jgi:hypothetical protein